MYVVELCRVEGFITKESIRSGVPTTRDGFCRAVRELRSKDEQFDKQYPKYLRLHKVSVEIALRIVRYFEPDALIKYRSA